MSNKANVCRACGEDNLEYDACFNCKGVQECINCCGCDDQDEDGEDGGDELLLNITEGGNSILGNFWRVTAWVGDNFRGEQLFEGYTKAEALALAGLKVEEKGGLGIWAD